MTSITPVEDASTYLVAPTAEGHGDYIWKLRASAGIIVAKIPANKTMTSVIGWKLKWFAACTDFFVVK